MEKEGQNKTHGKQQPNGPTKKNPKEIIIGNYRITKTLGQGTFGKVKEGIHLWTEQKVRHISKLIRP